MVFITTDLQEALYLSDRIVVMNKGKIKQIGTPKEIMKTPKTDFVKLLIKRIESKTL